MAKFIQTSYDMGIIMPEEKVNIEFPFDGEKSEILHAEPECGCTADIKIEDGKISAIFTESDGVKRTNAEQQFPSGLWPVYKSITVYFNDGLDLKTLSPNGLIFNPNKKQEILTFHGQVKFKGE